MFSSTRIEVSQRLLASPLPGIRGCWKPSIWGLVPPVTYRDGLHLNLENVNSVTPGGSFALPLTDPLATVDQKVPSQVVDDYQMSVRHCRVTPSPVFGGDLDQLRFRPGIHDYRYVVRRQLRDIPRLLGPVFPEMLLEDSIQGVFWGWGSLEYAVH